MNNHDHGNDLQHRAARSEIEGFLTSLPSEADVILLTFTPTEDGELAHFQLRSSIVCDYTRMAVLAEVLRKETFELCEEAHT